ncbi:hypothetical protein [Dethiobacter alkaliphilus]|uniref:Uncharacterized protein n=1 Tax=Dethiobacter alkaliphilus AHT 1 TaxID=555088 RepID=C0GEN6_DETAL|nr:hypothetical protein [Dethiobacter alkaliphilus]EEG78068.1 hypothetical protein DealDRAFT_0945 [Dethiobacter alkaliphilus AHT 1]
MDKTAAGAGAGFVSGLVIGLISIVLFITSVCELCLINIGGGIFMRQMLTQNALPVWQALGWLVHLSVSVVLGIILAHILSVTGKDWALLKGAIWGAVIWLITIGGVSPLGGYITVPPRPEDIFLLFAYHVLFGLLAAWLLVRFGSISETNKL